MHIPCIMNCNFRLSIRMQVKMRTLFMHVFSSFSYKTFLTFFNACDSLLLQKNRVRPLCLSDSFIFEYLIDKFFFFLQSVRVYCIILIKLNTTTNIVGFKSNSNCKKSEKNLIYYAVYF